MSHIKAFGRDDLPIELAMLVLVVMISHMTADSEQALQVLRTVWQGQPSLAPDLELDEDCNPNKSCKNMKEVTFDGFAEPGQDLGTAWREKLAREGKLNTSGSSIRDLILDSIQPK